MDSMSHFWLKYEYSTDPMCVIVNTNIQLLGELIIQKKYHEPNIHLAKVSLNKAQRQG